MVEGQFRSARTAAAHVFVDDLAAPGLEEEDRHHLERVLRLRPGEMVSTADGRGGWRMCQYTGAGNSGAAPAGLGSRGGLEPVGDIVYPATAVPDITVAFALTKGDRPEWAVQKLTEIGVDRIVPLVTARSVVRWEGPRAERHLSRLREVARQAAMQSRRLRLPHITAVQSLDELIGSPSLPPAAMAVPGGSPPSLRQPTVLIGPEGGWTAEEETETAPTVGLGPTVLRTETAAVVAGTLLVALRTGLVMGTV